MSAREDILKAIAGNKPASAALPAISFDELIQYADVLAQFKTVLQSIGGVAEEIADFDALKKEIAIKKETGEWVINRIEALGPLDAVDNASATQLEKLDVAYIQGTLAVAENGCIWLYESQMGNRIVPFICQHLVIVVDAKNIVPTMHHAYQQLDTAKEGFGVFLAGPSKTADIEQSLVIGAHGARSLRVFLLR
ncbi:MAG TPA: LUD domain-containing protein [Phnomibacter sp.]|nr:LUD domain-containing protein [Phnomibacter sp.]